MIGMGGVGGMNWPNLRKLDETTKDAEPLDHVVKWNNNYLINGPLSLEEYDAVSFRWSKDITKAGEYSKTIAKHLARFYDKKGYSKCEAKFRDTE